MILVTGATGLVGSHLALHLLDNEKTVIAIYRNKSGIQKTKQVFDYYKKSHLFEKINWIEADILDIPSLENAFQNIRGGLNSEHQGQFVFGGGNTTDAPVTAATLDDLVAAPSVASVFVNGAFKTTSRVSEASTLETGFVANEAELRLPDRGRLSGQVRRAFQLDLVRQLNE